MKEDRPKIGDRRPETDRHIVGRLSSVVGRSSPVGLRGNQAAAAHTLDRHVSVTAGPGAGKTTVLVERYLHILRTTNATVDQIVAITFTNRAANEMRERLRKELDRLLRSAPAKDRAKWMRHKRTLDGAIITTIHGFCARLLREFPVEAEIDPQFALLDEHQSAMLIESVVEERLTEEISAGDEAITKLTAGFGRGMLVEGLIGIYHSLRNLGLGLDEVVKRTTESHATAEDYRRCVDVLNAKMTELIRTRWLSGSAEAGRAQVETSWLKLHPLLEAEPGSISIDQYCDALEGFRKVRPDKRGKLIETVGELDELLWNSEGLGGVVPQTCFDLHARDYALVLIETLRRIDQRLDEEKRRLSALDFDDLQLRALKLLDDRPEVLRRTAQRYRFFLVDEFQDTNSLQRDLLEKLVLSARTANLFIVGDRKQSVYGFRGADVDVFREMTGRIVAERGIAIPLNLNFRSQPPLIHFFNYLFARLFKPDEAIDGDELNELGYVEHEASESERETDDPPPLVELLIDVETDDEQKTGATSKESSRERDALQLARRIVSLINDDDRLSHPEGPRKFRYRDIALLFRAMTEVPVYESVFRRAGIPYLTVQGKGFYAREEITDLIQLLRFLDNKTDEIALAAVLRSPLCGISDNALFALRCAPLIASAGDRVRIQKRNLWRALRQQREIDLIADEERPALDRAGEFLEELVKRAKRQGLEELLRFAVESSEFMTVIAANFDGAQRLANVEKLFTLAERFERSGAYLIRDFVRFVRDFEEAGGRESEGQIDESADAVRLMTIHQAKGLEFPVVIIPELHRQSEAQREWWFLDRHRGLTLKVPDGRGGRLVGLTLRQFRERAKRREQFESVRLLYVAATRARDRLIVSGATQDLARPRNDTWLAWILKALELKEVSESGVIKRDEGVEFQLTLNLLGAPVRSPDSESDDPVDSESAMELPLSIGDVFPLLERVRSETTTGLHRFSVTQLLNVHRCPRQYYFDRVLHAPGEEEVAVWNNAEAPEPPANLTATLRGAVIHRFCEKFSEGDELQECLKSSFEDVLRQRAAELGDRVLDINRDRAIHNLLPLARNYLGSSVRQRIESARALTNDSFGVFSEQRFRLRRPLGLLTGTIDKLLISRSGDGISSEVEIIDFKTNRFRGKRGDSGACHEQKVGERKRDGGQLSFGFLDAVSSAHSSDDLLIRAEIQSAAADYQIQMQAYALAAHELITGVKSVRVTLHFLDPDVEVSLSEELLDHDACAKSIDEAMLRIVFSSGPESFPALPAEHCRVCSFTKLCPPGRRWLSLEGLQTSVG
jgi:ATP-dependent helicase/nuclease subunit A